MKDDSISDFDSAVLIVGAKKFLFSSQVQSSKRVGWWGPAEESVRRRELVPGKPGKLRQVFVRHMLARAPRIKAVALSEGAECVEFNQESELYPYLTKVLGIEADPAKSLPGAPRLPALAKDSGFNQESGEVEFSHK
jgi:hypothetical protein